MCGPAFAGLSSLLTLSNHSTRERLQVPHFTGRKVVAGRSEITYFTTTWWEVAGQQLKLRSRESMRWRRWTLRKPYVSVVRAPPTPGLGSGSLRKHRPEPKALFPGNQEEPPPSLSPLLPPSQHPVYCPELSPFPSGLSFGKPESGSFFSGLYPFTPFPEGRANSPCDRKGKGKEEKRINASALTSCHNILLCSARPR